MSPIEDAGSVSAIRRPEHPVTVLLVNDQPIIAEAVRRMLAGAGRHPLPLLQRSHPGDRAGQRTGPDGDPPGPGDARGSTG